MIPIDAITAALTSDGDTFDLPDGRTVRLRITPDDIDPFDEYGSFGKIGEIRRNDFSNRGERPARFDGNAEKLWAGQSHQVWWQPPADGPTRSSEGFAELRQLVTELLEFGMIVVTVEILNGTDAYGRPIAQSAESLSGIEPFPKPEYLAEVIGDLLISLNLTKENNS